jgi:hypothetical protein
MGTESEVVDSANVDVDLHDLRRMEVSVARRRTLWPSSDVVLPKGGEAGKEGCVCSGRCEVAICVFASVRVGDVDGYVVQ